MITFIIPAHDEELLIGQTISALHDAASATSEPYEIIVVDDASTDATTKVAARCGARTVSVHYRQIAAARNAGAAHAQGDLLVFVDADTHIPGTAVGAALHAVRLGAVGGGSRARFDGLVPIYGRFLRIIAGFALHGPRFFRTRHGPWYGQRRDDPDHTAQPDSPRLRG